MSGSRRLSTKARLQGAESASAAGPVDAPHCMPEGKYCIYHAKTL